MAYSSSTSSAKGEEWLNCEVCGLTFKNEKHYSIHCGGTFHANRVAASLRAASQNPSKTTVDSQTYTSNNPSYWTGLQQSFSDKKEAEPPQDRSLRAQGHQESTAYPTQAPEYVSYPVGKHAKSTGGNAGDGYEGMYGMPGFGWSNAPSGQGSDDGGGSQSYFGEWQSDSRQASKGPAEWQSDSRQMSKGPARLAEQSTWDGGYYSGGGNEGPAAGQGFPGAAIKPQESARVSQKSDVPAWYRMIEPVVSNSQRIEPYGLSGKPAQSRNDGGLLRHDSGSKRPAELGTGWNSTGSGLDISGKLRQLREEGLSRKGKDPVSQSGWDAGGYMTESGREQGRDDRGTRGIPGRFGEGGELGQAGRIRETDSFRNSDYYSDLDAKNREELSRRREDNFTSLGRKDGFQTDSHGSETSYYRDDQSGRREMFAARLLEKQREDSSRREDRSQSDLGRLDKREPVAKTGRYEEVARVEFESKLLQMQQHKRNTMPWEEPQDDWNKRDFGESAKSGWTDVGAGRGKVDATVRLPQRNAPFGAARGFTAPGMSRAPSANDTQDARSSGGSMGGALGSVGARPDRRPAWEGQRWPAGYGPEKGEQGLGSGNTGSIDSRLKQLSAVSQKRDAEMTWKDEWGGGKSADEGHAPDRMAPFAGVDRPGVGRGQLMAGGLKTVGRGAGGSLSDDKITIGGQSQGVGRIGDGSRERIPGIGGPRNSFATSQGAPRISEQFPGVSGLAGVGRAGGGFPKAPTPQSARGAVGVQNLGPVPETGRGSAMSIGRGVSAVGPGPGTNARPESDARAPVGQQKTPGYPIWSAAPSKSQGASAMPVAAVAKSSVASQRPIPSLLDMNLSFGTSGAKKEEQSPRDNTANQKNPIQMKIQLGSKSEKDSNVPKRDLDKTPVTAVTVRMSQAVAKTTMSPGQTISGKVAAKPPALFGGSFGKPPGVATPTTLTTPTSQAGKGVPSGPGKLQPASDLATWASEMLVKSAVVDATATKSAISQGKSSLLPTPVPSRVAVTQPSAVQDANSRKALLPTPNSAGQIQGDLAGSKYPAGGDGKNKTDGGVTPAKDLPLVKTTAVASAVKKIPLQGIPVRSPATLDSKVAPTASSASGANITEAAKTAKNPTASSTGPRPAPALPAGPGPLTAAQREPRGLQKAPVPGVRGGSGKKDASENIDEFDPALSEAVGQFFSDDSAIMKTVKALNSAKVSSSAVPTNVAAAKPKDVSAISRSSESVKPGSSSSSSLIAPNSSNEPGKKSDGAISKSDPKPNQLVGVGAGVTPVVRKVEDRPPVAKTMSIKMELEEGDQNGRDQRQSSDHDPISELSKYLPPEIMREITSGQPPKELLERVANLLPADVLLQAVEFLKNCNAVRDARTPAAEALKDVTRVKPGGSGSGTSRIQVIAPRKGLVNSGKLDAAKVPLSKLPVDMKSGPMEHANNDPLTAGKRKYDIDISKLKDLSVEDMLKLFQELLQDVLGSLFDEEKKCSVVDENKILAGLSVDDRNLALSVRRATGISDISKIVHTLNVLKTLDPQTVLALGRLDKSVIASSLSGNKRAQAMGVRVLQQITDLMAKENSAEKMAMKGVPNSADQAKRPAPVSSGTVRPLGVQSLLSLSFSGPTEAPRMAGAVGPPKFPASSGAGLLPTPMAMQQNSKQQNSKAFSGAEFSGSGLLPTPPRYTAIGNFPAAKRKMAPPSDRFFGAGPEPKRWR